MSFFGKKVVLIAPAFNEGTKILEVVRRAQKTEVDEIVVVDDGSTDSSMDAVAAAGATVLPLGACLGVGAALRSGLYYARNRGYDVAVIIAGNNKDNPEEIVRLVSPIAKEGIKFVVGSRYLPGGAFGGDMPRYRQVATRLHPWLVSLFCGKRVTESTNGFRAIRLDLLDEPWLNLEQDWLNGYELEIYMLMKTLLLKAPHCEVPCSKIYPPRKQGNTKMRPFVDWWHMLAPIFWIGLRLRA